MEQKWDKYNYGAAAAVPAAFSQNDDSTLGVQNGDAGSTVDRPLTMTLRAQPFMQTDLQLLFMRAALTGPAASSVDCRWAGALTVSGYTEGVGLSYKL